MKRRMVYNICICLFVAALSIFFSTSGYAQENIFVRKNTPALLLPSEAFLLASTFSVPPSGVVPGEGNLLFVPAPPGGGTGTGDAGGAAPVGNGLWGMICATLVYALYSRKRTGKVIHSISHKQINK